MPGAPSRGGRKARGGGGTNHAGLLGFTVGNQEIYDEQTYEQQTRAIAAQSDRPRGGYRSAKSHYTTPANKDGFVISNFRLGVHEGEGDVANHLQCTDTVLPWDTVEQVVTWGAFDEHRCPICLDQPRAARITDCGHIFCLPCLVQLNQRFAQDGRKCKCPLCHKAVDIAQIKMVSLLPVKTHKPGETVSFTLLRRERGNVLAFTSEDILSVMRPPSALVESSRFGRYFTLTRTDLLDLLSADTAQLTMSLEEALDEGDEEETLLLQESLQMVVDSCERVNARYGGAADAVAADGGASAAVQDAVDDPTRLCVYYQSTDGQFMGLSPIHLRMIIHHHGTQLGLSEAELDHMPWSCLPAQLDLPLEDLETYTQNEQTIKRFRYFNHLPYGAQFSVAYPDLRGVVGAATVQAFAAQNASRKKKKAEEKRAEEAELKRREKREREQKRARQEEEVYAFTGEVVPQQLPADFGNDLTAFPSLGGGDAATPTTPAAASSGWSAPPAHTAAPPEEPAAPPPTMIPRRIHPTTGVALTRADFAKHAADEAEAAALWDQAVETVPIVEALSMTEIQALERQRTAGKPAGPKKGAWGQAGKAVPPPQTIRAVASSSAKAPEEKPQFDVMQQLHNAAAAQPAAAGGKGKKKNKGVKISLNTGAVTR